SSDLNLKRYRTYFYDARPYKSNNPSPEESDRYSKFDKFIYSLRNLPSFEIRLGKLVKRDDEFIQKGVDILLAIDIVKLSLKDRVRHIALISGDADYVPAVELARNEGVKIYLFHSPERGQYADELYQNTDERTTLTLESISEVKIQNSK
ncbi:MAG: NYN domain-containing protein, partial [Nitrososphaerota archaeon]